MILKLHLQHTREKNRNTSIELYGIDANHVAAIRQGNDKSQFNKFVSDIISKRLPTHYYNFEVTDWEFIDHRGSEHERIRDPGDTPVVRQLRNLLHSALPEGIPAHA